MKSLRKESCSWEPVPAGKSAVRYPSGWHNKEPIWHQPEPSRTWKQPGTQILQYGVMAEVVRLMSTSEINITGNYSSWNASGNCIILANNAGLLLMEPIDQMSTETWDWVINIELRAVFICTREAMRIMKKQGGGRIINIGSISAQRVRPFTAPYNSAKFGLVG